MIKSDLCASDPAGIRYGLTTTNRVVMASYGCRAPRTSRTPSGRSSCGPRWIASWQSRRASLTRHGGQHLIAGFQSAKRPAAFFRQAQTWIDQ